MRPIDADAFVEAIKKDLRKYPEDDLIYPVMEWFLDNIKSRPTIEQPTWIPVTERLPTEEDSNEYDCVLAVNESYGERVVDSWHYKTVCDYIKDFSYWMPFSFLPEPPKKSVKDDNI